LEHPIAFGGRSLRGSELKWHMNDKKALALVEGVQHFRDYVENQKFTVYTDNVSVKYLQKIKDCQGRLGRWSLLLQGYNFQIEHRTGTRNTADCLSRQQFTNTEPITSTDLAEHLYSIDTNSDIMEYIETTLFYKGEIEEEVIASLQQVDDHGIESSDLAKHQRECGDFKDIYLYKSTYQVPEDPPMARTIVAESFNYEIEDIILKHFYSKRCKRVPKQERLVKQIAVPRILRDDILRSYHHCIAGGGHQGFERTFAALRNKYF